MQNRFRHQITVSSKIKEREMAGQRDFCWSVVVVGSDDDDDDDAVLAMADDELVIDPTIDGP